MVITERLQNIGFCQIFLAGLEAVNEHLDYFAFSDQDDIWYQEKLERAVNILSQYPKNQPMLYCTRSEIVDVSGKQMGYSPLYKKPSSFTNAMVQKINQ